MVAETLLKTPVVINNTCYLTFKILVIQILHLVLKCGGCEVNCKPYRKRQYLYSNRAIQLLLSKVTPRR